MAEDKLLARCAFCGGEDRKPHKKYSDRCDACGKTYATYANYKSLQKSKPNPKRAIKLERIVDEYRMMKRHGYKVPRDIV